MSGRHTVPSQDTRATQKYSYKKIRNWAAKGILNLQSFRIWVLIRNRIGFGFSKGLGSSPNSLESSSETPFQVPYLFEDLLHVLFRLLTFFVQREFPAIWTKPARQDRGVREEYTERLHSNYLDHEAHIYLEYHSVCPLVGIGPPPLLLSNFYSVFLLDIWHTRTSKPPPRSFKYSSVCLIHLMFVAFWTQCCGSALI